MSTNPPTQIRKTTLYYPCTTKVYILLKNSVDVIPWSESKPGLNWRLEVLNQYIFPAIQFDKLQ